MMTVLRALEHPIVEALGWSLLHFVWQGIIVAGLIAAVLYPLRRMSAQVRYLVLCGGMSLMALCPVVTWYFVAMSIQFEPAGDLSRPNSFDGDLQHSKEQTVTVNLGSRERADDLRSQSDGPNSTGESLHIFPVYDSHTGATPHDSGDYANSLQSSVEINPLLLRWRAFWSHKLPWLVSAWLIGVLGLSIRLLTGWRAVQRIRYLATKSAPSAWQAKLQLLATRLRVSWPVKLVESVNVAVPTVIGWLRPVILLPPSVLTGLESSQLEALLAHELAHIRRNDFLINLIQTTIETLLFYHPAIWWISHRIRDEREHCCDDIAVEICGNNVTYARALATMEELRGRPSLTMAADGGSLLGRIRRLLCPAPDARRSSWGASLIAMTTISAMGIVAYIGSQAGAEPPEKEQATPLQKDVADPAMAEAATRVELEETLQAKEDRVATAKRLTSAVQAAANKFSTGRLDVAFEKLTEMSWISGKKGQPLFKTDGTMNWIGDKNLWRIDYDGQLPNSGSPIPAPDNWSTGFDGEHHYSWDRNRNSVVIGRVKEHASQYTPANLFWAPNGGGLDTYLKYLSDPATSIIPVTIDQLDGFRADFSSVEHPEWRWSTFICPHRGHLPLQIQNFHKNRLAWECELKELVEIQPEIWYPKSIRYSSYTWSKDGQREIAWQTEFTVSNFELTPKTPIDRQAFQVKPSFGADVTNLVEGISYQNDVWWSELAPILRQKFDYPKTSYASLGVLASNLKQPIGEKKLPALDLIGTSPSGPAKEKRGEASWLNSKPYRWEDLKGKVTLLVFWSYQDGRSAEVLAALKRLQTEFGTHGLQVIAIHLQNDPEVVRPLVAELKLPFPVAIDDDGSSGNGAFYDMIGVRGLPAAILVDHQQTLQPIPKADQFGPQLISLLSAAGAKNLPPLDIKEGLTDELVNGIRATWMERVGQAPQTCSIVGKVVDAKNQPIANAEVQSLLALHLLTGSYGSHTVFPDFKGKQNVQTDANGLFAIPNLVKGQYGLTVTAKDKALYKQEIALIEGEAHSLTVTLKFSDVISGQVHSNGKPVANVKVSIRWRHHDPENLERHTSSPGAMPVTTTDAAGQFRFEKLELGHYTIDFSADGFEPAAAEKVLLGRRDVEINLKPVEKTDKQADPVPPKAEPATNLPPGEEEDRKAAPVAGANQNEIKPGSVIHLIDEGKIDSAKLKLKLASPDQKVRNLAAAQLRSNERTQGFRYIDGVPTLYAIGCSIERQNNRTVIEQIVPGGAAAKDGRLKVGDEILAVSNEQGQFQNADQALLKIAELMRGQSGTKVRLKVLTKADRKTVEYELPREPIQFLDQMNPRIVTLKGLKPGANRTSLLKLLELTDKDSEGSIDEIEDYRLDDNQLVRFWFDESNRTLVKFELFARVRAVWLDPPADFTGVWTTYYVNGMKCKQIAYQDGKYNGPHQSYYDNGTLLVAQNYVMQVCNGEDIGYFPSGKVMYRGLYQHDKQVGTWTFYNEDGSVRSKQEYGDPKLEKTTEPDKTPAAVIPKISLDFNYNIEAIDKPLDQILLEFARTAKLKLQIDQDGLEEVQVKRDVKCNFVITEVTARNALKLLLKPYGLGYVVVGDVLRISSLNRLEKELTSEAIEQGIAFLKSEQKMEGSWPEYGNLEGGGTAIVTAALLQAGVKPDDPSIQKALIALRKQRSKFIYTVALRTMIFCAASPKEDAELIRSHVAWIENAQGTRDKANGGWSYNENSGGRADGSCTRFAVLGLHAAQKAGFAVKPKTWQGVSDYWLFNQLKDGKWGYTYGAPGTPTMTLSGIACLGTAHRFLPADEQAKLREAAMKKASEHVVEMFPKLQRDAFPFYAFHSLERAANITNTTKFGDIDWQPALTKMLIGSQRLDGAWTELGKETPSAAKSELVSTSFALLVLSGAPEVAEAQK